MNQWRLLQVSTSDAFWNMAVDEAIFMSSKSGKALNSVRFYQWKPSAASIGRNQAINDEIDLAEADRLGIDVVRRITGGGAVFHADGGEVTYSVIVNEKSVSSLGDQAIFFKLSRGISMALSKLGLQTEEETIHCPSIFVRNRKISGNAQAKRRGIILQHGTLLLKYDPDLMYTVLKAKSQRTKSKMIQSVFQKVTTLEQELGYVPSQDTIAEALVDGFQNSLGVSFVEDKLSNDEFSLAKQLSNEKYASKEWTFKY
ncbi:MAG: biotin/lipoate A/B protein ligase family protein [Candidatus Heimdallarchaeota archaeon]